MKDDDYSFSLVAKVIVQHTDKDGNHKFLMKDEGDFFSLLSHHLTSGQITSVIASQLLVANGIVDAKDVELVGMIDDVESKELVFVYFTTMETDVVFLDKKLVWNDDLMSINEQDGLIFDEFLTEDE